MAVRVFSRTATTCVFLLTLLGAAACKEESGVRVSSMTVQRHQGRQAVAAQIGAGDRRQLEVAVGREALLQSRAVRGGPEADRGVLPRPRFPDARISSFDVKLSADQSSVAIALNISEGEPIIAERVDFEGFEPLPAEHCKGLMRGCR